MSPVERRFFSKVLMTDGCWLWQASTSLGYGVFWDGERQTSAHRYSYEQLVGPIPEGLVIDHVCHNRDESCKGGECYHRRCVRPDHLEAVSQGTNTLRGRTIPGANASKTHCPRGHPYDTENTYTSPKGDRHCMECRRLARRARDQTPKGRADKARRMRQAYNRDPHKFRDRARKAAARAKAKRGLDPNAFRESEGGRYTIRVTT